MLNLIRKSIFVLRNYGIKCFFIKTLRWMNNRISVLRSRWLIEKRVKDSTESLIKELKVFSSDNPEEVFDFARKFCSGFINPMQSKEEFVELLRIFKELKPRYIVEIGTAYGGTLFCFCKLAEDDATIISIDLPGGYSDWKDPIYHAFAKENQKLFLLKEDSHKQETLEKVRKLLNGNKLDFLFIDADHTYEGVKKDFEMYSSLVRKGGIIVFHDILLGSEECVRGVKQFWREVKSLYNSREIVENWNQIAGGIGILFL